MLEVRDLSCKFGSHLVLSGISFCIPNGKIFTVIGGSGAGKTTIIRALSGLERENSHGEVMIDGHKVKHGDYGLVPQGYSLFKHMTVLQNVAYALRVVKKFPKKQAESIAINMLENFGLGDKLNSYPFRLSGGQKQRVAIARILVLDPKVLLFDEPTSALDPEMTTSIIKIIKQIASNGISILIVTHDLVMARKVSDHILFLEAGKIIENAPTAKFFTEPKTSRAKAFLSNAAYIG